MNVLDEYMVKLGAVVDQSGMTRFQNALREAGSAADHTAFGMAKSFFKMQSEIVAGFTAVAGATLGLVDKVAMADQEYRLFALHMYMSKDAARGLKVAMDALGEPLENLTWDPELRKRTQQLIEDQRNMSPDGDFEAQMKKIRDVRFEFTRMEVELKYLGMHVVQDFMTALGLGPDELLGKLKTFNKWVQDELPALSKRIVKDFMPIWQDMKELASATGEAFGNAGVMFTNFVGLATGDDSLVGTTSDLEKMATAVDHIAHGFAGLGKLIAQVESSLSHFAIGMTLLKKGEFSAAGDEFKSAFAVMDTPEGKALLDTLTQVGVGPAQYGTALVNAAGTALSEGIVDTPTVQASDVTQGKIAVDRVHRWKNLNPFRRESWVKEYAPDWASLSSLTGGVVPPELLAAISDVESAGQGQNARAYDKNGNLAGIGWMGLTRTTAKGYGVDPFSEEGNLTGGTYLLRDLMKQYHGDIKDPASLARVIGAYHSGPAAQAAAEAGKITDNAASAEIGAVLRRLNVKGDVQAGAITVHVTVGPGTDAEHANLIATKVAAKVKEAQDKQTQRNLVHAQVFGSGW